MQNKMDTSLNEECKVINIFKNNQEEERKKALQDGIANIICRTESNDKMKYIRAK